MTHPRAEEADFVSIFASQKKTYCTSDMITLLFFTCRQRARPLVLSRRARGLPPRQVYGVKVGARLIQAHHCSAIAGEVRTHQSTFFSRERCVLKVETSSPRGMHGELGGTTRFLSVVSGDPLLILSNEVIREMRGRRCFRHVLLDIQGATWLRFLTAQHEMITRKAIEEKALLGEDQDVFVFFRYNPEMDIKAQLQEEIEMIEAMEDEKKPSTADKQRVVK